MQSSSKGEISQDWQEHEKCPEGIAPVRRSTSSITRKHPSLLRSHFNSSLFVGPEGIHEYAFVRSYVDGRFFGASAMLSIWKPKVNHDEFSLAQLWISSGFGADLNTIEVGWTVFPKRYGDNEPRFFTFWTRDNYNTTGCYDSDCPGFVQVDFSVKLGQVISPISIVGGQTSGITIMVYKGENGHWWLDVNGVDIGYFPKNLFTALSEYADRVDFGGEILNSEKDGHHTTTQMGNGLYPHQQGASFISGIRIYDQNKQPVEGILHPVDSTVPYYGVILVNNDTMFYGGPGYSQFYN
ncbi:uncharacterized protein LOC124943150 [Impatiens glandulifera]|uniref:uncharacterized protein LOC124943150 n=1 Tax=Impatiens glandulifera TaxID=253017 RepID=UPI001FB10E41|nr:uncharacterized protein LOC124943150 [Impatiens glandulifera]